MASDAPYDKIADWYETQFVGHQQFKAGVDAREQDPLGLDHALRSLLGEGRGTCLEIGCGTGSNTQRIRALGWKPVGVDISTGMLRHARGRLPVAHADAERLPVKDCSVPAVVAVMVNTDMPNYPVVLREVTRVLVPAGKFVHIGVHPCFCGSFADRSNADAVLIRPGYLSRHWSTSSWTSEGIRSRVGSTHWPLSELLHAMLEAGLTLRRFMEGGQPTPAILAIRGEKTS